MTTTSWILGGHQTDFARNLGKEGLDAADLTREVVLGTLGAGGVEPDQIESIHVGNAFGQLYTGQGHLGAMPATVVPELWGVPAMRHEAACASSSIAALSAMAELEAGRYDCVLVVGLEQEKTMSGPDAARTQAAAAGPVTRPTVSISSGPSCSARSPRSTTAASESTTATSGPSAS